MIISRTPYRISFAGGASDIKDFYKHHEYGAVLSATINKYVFLSMHPLFNSTKTFLKYSESEMVDSVSQIKHPIIREVFSDYEISGVDFNSSSDIPSGTGLGSSSSFTVGLVNLCNAYKHSFMSKENIAKDACNFEINRLGAPVGKQDQYAAAIGGINFIKFFPDESVSIEKISLSEEVLSELEGNLMLFYLGNSRLASDFLSKQKNDFNSITKMVRLAEDLRGDLKNNDISNFGSILHHNWEYKKELSSVISNKDIDAIYDLAIKHGATGGKLLGAGGTGFLLFCVPLRYQQEVRKHIDLYELPFKFDCSGTIIIY